MKTGYDVAGGQARFSAYRFILDLSADHICLTCLWCLSSRQTASNLAVADVLDLVDSPSTGEAVADGLEGAGTEGLMAAVAAAASANKKAKKGHNRRMTADFSTINSLLDYSTTTEESSVADNDDTSAAAFAASPPPSGRGLAEEAVLHKMGAAATAAAEAATRDATANYSSIVNLVEKGPPSASLTAGRTGTRPAASSTTAPRAKHHSNQKPGRDSLAQGLVEPVSSLLGASMSISGGGGGEEAGPSTNNPAAPTERVRRPRHSISRKALPENWEDLVMPSPIQVTGWFQKGVRLRGLWCCGVDVPGSYCLPRSCSRS